MTYRACRGGPAPVDSRAGDSVRVGTRTCVARRERLARKLVRRYLNSVVRVAQYTAYERLFSLWHVAHIPFVYLLVVSADRARDRGARLLSRSAWIEAMAETLANTPAPACAAGRAAVPFWDLPARAAAQGIESILAPGKVITGHAKWKTIAPSAMSSSTARRRTGCAWPATRTWALMCGPRPAFTGARSRRPATHATPITKGAMRGSCVLDKNKFDHSQTDYALRGKHQKVECDKCHVAGQAIPGGALDCNACHRKDDVHKGGLGVKCADCHARVQLERDHVRPRQDQISLTGKHMDTKCADCHKNDVTTRKRRRTCVGCHQQDDDAQGPQRSVWREVRELPRHQGLEAVDLQP